MADPRRRITGGDDSDPPSPLDNFAQTFTDANAFVDRHKKALVALNTHDSAANHTLEQFPAVRQLLDKIVRRFGYVHPSTKITSIEITSLTNPETGQVSRYHYLFHTNGTISPSGIVKRLKEPLGCFEFKPSPDSQGWAVIPVEADFLERLVKYETEQRYTEFKADAQGMAKRYLPAPAEAETPEPHGEKAIKNAIQQKIETELFGRAIGIGKSHGRGGSGGRSRF